MAYLVPNAPRNVSMSKIGYIQSAAVSIFSLWSTDLFVTYLGLFGLCISDLQGVVRGQPPLVPVCVHIGVHPVIRPVSPLVFAATVSTLRHLSRRKTGLLRGTAAARPLLAWNKVSRLECGGWKAIISRNKLSCIVECII